MRPFLGHIGARPAVMRRGLGDVPVGSQGSPQLQRARELLAMGMRLAEIRMAVRLSPAELGALERACGT